MNMLSMFMKSCMIPHMPNHPNKKLIVPNLINLTKGLAEPLIN